jgi:hypothetical protein
MEKTLGQIAYEAYYNDCSGKSIRGEDLPTWDGQGDTIKQHWEAAGLAACQVGGNYTANNEVYPTEIQFINGRKVKVMPLDWDEEVYLKVE